MADHRSHFAVQRTQTQGSRRQVCLRPLPNSLLRRFNIDRTKLGHPTKLFEPSRARRKPELRQASALQAPSAYFSVDTVTTNIAANQFCSGGTSPSADRT